MVKRVTDDPQCTQIEDTTYRKTNKQAKNQTKTNKQKNKLCLHNSELGNCHHNLKQRSQSHHQEFSVVIVSNCSYSSCQNRAGKKKKKVRHGEQGIDYYFTGL